MKLNLKKIIVIGAPRSGTTLVGGLLTNSNVAMPMLPECTIITQLIDHYNKTVKYSDIHRFSAYCLDEKNLQKTYQKAINDLILNACSHFKNKDENCLVLKDPELTLLPDLIATFFGEDAISVCVVRDPRDVISSMIKVMRKKQSTINKKLNNKWLKNVLDKFNNFSEADEMINYIFNYYYIAHTSELYNNKKLLMVQYEKIINGEEDEFSKIEKVIGYEIGRESFGKVYFDFDKTDATYSQNYGKEIKKVESTYEQILSKKTIEKIKYIFSGYNVLYKWW